MEGRENRTLRKGSGKKSGEVEEQGGKKEWDGQEGDEEEGWKVKGEERERRTGDERGGEERVREGRTEGWWLRGTGERSVRERV